MQWRSHLLLQWRHNRSDGVSSHQPHDCLLSRLFRHRLKKTSKLRVTGLCEGNSPLTGEFPAQMTSNAENVSIWRRHHAESHTRTRMNRCLHLNTLRPRQNGRHFEDNISKCIFVNESFCISNDISMSYWQCVIIGSDNRRQAIIWTNDGLVNWRMNVSVGLDDLKEWKID